MYGPTCDVTTTCYIVLVLGVGGYGEKAWTRPAEGEEGDGTVDRSERVEWAVFEETSSGTAEWGQRPAGTRQQTEV